MGPSLVRGFSVVLVRGFDGQNISSQKPHTREVLATRCIPLDRAREACTPAGRARFARDQKGLQRVSKR